MDRISWYFRQSVTEGDMDFIDNATESAIEKAFSESQHPFGVVSGYLVAPAAGLNIEVTGTSVAYDKQGRRISPSVATITQSIATATDGGSTAVGSGGNERWLSVFARAGRRFTDPATDGNSLAVRKYALEVLNALGDTDHPAGAYNGVTAKEAGVNLFYLVVGAENAFGFASRPALIEDGVLIADIRLTNGLTTLTTANIFTDRRQVLVAADVGALLSARDSFSGPFAGVAFGNLRYGVTAEAEIAQTASMSLEVFGGAGYAADHDASTDRVYRRFRFDQAVGVPVQPADPTFHRYDLLVVNGLNELRVKPGIAGDNSPPGLDSGEVALAELRVVAGATNTLSCPFIRRQGRLLPYPFSTMTGIIEGCRLGWNWVGGAATAADLFIASKQNKIAFRGEVVEFEGGIDDNSLFTTVATSDLNSNPYGTLPSGANIQPYYIYACRKQFYVNGLHVGPVSIVESLTPPDVTTGHASAVMLSDGTVKRFIQPEDSLLIGIGWVNSGGRVPVLATDDGWFRPLLNNMTALVPSVGASTVQLPASPATVLVDRVLVRVQSVSSVSSTVSWGVGTANQPGSTKSLVTVSADVNAPRFSQHGHFDLHAEGGWIYTSGSGVSVFPVAWRLKVPRIGLLGGA